MGAHFRLVAVLLLLAPLHALACSPCRTLVFASVFDSSFGARLVMVVAPVVIVVALGAWLWRSSDPRLRDAR